MRDRKSVSQKVQSCLSSGIVTGKPGLKEFSIPITVFIIVFVILSIGLFPNTANAKEITYFSIDVWTNKGGQGVGKGGGSYKVGEQVILYVTATNDCQAMVTVTGPGGTNSTQVSVGFNNTKTISLGTADQSDIGSWQAKAVTLTSF